MLRLVPGAMREAALSLGIPQWKVTTQILFRAAAPGIVTGILLALARISGETAPLLFTALNNQYWTTDVLAPMANVPVVILCGGQGTRLREETERRQDEARHRDAERLDSLRRMAGGTAHVGVSVRGGTVVLFGEVGLLMATPYWSNQGTVSMAPASSSSSARRFWCRGASRS